MTYELMVLAVPTLDLTTDKKQMEFVKKIVGDSVDITEVVSLGKKSLAFEIKKQTEATYLVVKLSGLIKSGDIDAKMKLMDDVMRVMLTKVN